MTDEILFERRGAAGVVTLNRPAALNAVTHGMVLRLRAQLEAWAADDAVTRVVVTANGERAFSAGGDIRALTELGRAGRKDEMLQFWRDEYPLNAFIKNYPKPYIALIDGIVMGGGVGVSVHGGHRVAGERFDAADALAAGVATHRIPSARLPALLDGLCGTVPVNAILNAFAEPGGEGRLAPHRAAIDRLFAHDRVEDIVAALDREGDDWARKTAATIRAKSPLSLKIALAQVRRGKAWDFAACMRAEFRIVSRIVEGHDFYEGV